MATTRTTKVKVQSTTPTSTEPKKESPNFGLGSFSKWLGNKAENQPDPSAPTSKTAAPKVSMQTATATVTKEVSSTTVTTPTEKTTPTSELERLFAANGNAIAALNILIDEAYRLRSSDIHIDPRSKTLAVRLRIDGVLQTVFTLPKSAHEEVIGRIKILSGLRTDEHQSAQDGRFSHITNESKSIDVRVSIVPTYYGENCVMRLLADNAADYTLDALGFSESNQEKLRSAIQKPYGMILATGPTGSGKTTTLYTLIKMLNKEDVSIVTVEDPIEYSVERINQIQVNSRTNLTFANGLRSILRQDPNIIMVGEIRDHETAALGVNTALTGHLLLSTLHTNDAATTLPRLLDLGVEPYLIASTVNVAIGQRLLRRICQSCKSEKKLTPKESSAIAKSLGVTSENNLTNFFYGTGCKACNSTGYEGRVGVHEVLVLDQNVREAILRKSSSTELAQIAKAGGMITMVEDALEKAAKGQTTIEEVMRMLYE